MKLYAAEEKRPHEHNGCLHTCNEHTRVQSTLLQPYTSDTAALTYTTTLLPHSHTPLHYCRTHIHHYTTQTYTHKTLHKPTHAYTNLQTLHAYNTYILYIYTRLHTYSTPTYCTTVPTYTPPQPLQYSTSYHLRCAMARRLHTYSMSMWLASEAAICQ